MQEWLCLWACAVCVWWDKETQTVTHWGPAILCWYQTAMFEMNHLTSSKKRGLSGMNFSATREAMQGRAHTSTKTLQLWKWYLVPILNPQPGNSKSQQMKILTRNSEFFPLLKQLWTLQLCMIRGQVKSFLSTGGSWRLESVLSR